MPRRKPAGPVGLRETGGCRGGALEAVPERSRSLGQWLSAASRATALVATHLMYRRQEPCGAPVLSFFARRCTTSRHKGRCWRAAAPNLRTERPDRKSV